MISGPTILADDDDLQRLVQAAGGARVHLLGVGGVGMAGLAAFLQARGFAVDGCDVQTNRYTAWLEARGIPVWTGHDPAHLHPAPDWCVRSTAVPLSAPECKAAQAGGIPLVPRGEVLAALLRNEYAVAISGTHGKTTTTALTAHAVRAACGELTFFVGGDWEAPGRVFGQGSYPVTVVEADESDGTLAHYHPAITVLTGIDFDHMEHFADETAFVAVFAAVLRQTREQVIYCRDDPRLCALMAQQPHAGRSYGWHPEAYLRATDGVVSGHTSTFALMRAGEVVGRYTLSLPGMHNVQNALAALCVVDQLQGDIQAAASALDTFQPVRRRFERVGHWREVPVYSDYAHHPTEIKALLQAARTLGHRRILAIFQPHRYTRTRALGSQFPAAFAGADWVALTPVYAASEAPLPGGTTEDLAAWFGRDPDGPPCICAPDLDTAWQRFTEEAREGDVLLLVGAGDIEQLVHKVERDDES